MADEKDPLQNFKVEHLFLLIGRNPLPNYVAAKLLNSKQNKSGQPVKTTLYLLYSEDDDMRGLSGTAGYADNLKSVLGETEYEYKYVPIEPSEPDTIVAGINKYLPGIPSNSSVGLHYTGGTKAMSVHAYNTFIRSQRKVTYSYLDPRNLALSIDADIPGGESISFPLALTERPEESFLFKASGISLDQLLSLHDLKKLQRKDDNPHREVADPAFTKAMSDSIEDYINTSRLSGRLFEDFVLSQVLEIRSDCHIHEDDCGSSLEIAMPDKTNEQFFEVDVVAIRGYQLFAISCTLDVDPDPEQPGQKRRTGLSKCKQKLFEIKVRAEQLGGEEARVALVCPMGKPSQSNGAENLRRLREQLKGDNIRVFGYDDLANLKTQLQDWFTRGA